MDCRSGNDNDDYLYLDPKLLKRGDTLPKTRAPFQDAIVFIVGGGNYIEYQNLVDFIKVMPVRQFIWLIQMFHFILLLIWYSIDFKHSSNSLNFHSFSFQQKQTANSNKRIIYGASTLVNSKQFLRQLSLLGQEIKDI